MATALQNLIDAYIKRNANQEITGPVLNGVLTAISNALGTPFIGSDGYWYTYDAETGQFVKTDTPAQGETGPVGVTSAAASIDDQIGTPSVSVSLDGTRLDFAFRNLKGQKGDTGDAGITAAVVTVDAGIGTPSVDASITGTTLTLAFHNLKGETGAAAGFGTIEATVDDTTGTPAVVVTESGPDTAKNLSFAFSGLKGQKGDQGDTGVSADYPITIANNLTTDDPTAALAASQGVVLKGEIDQLGQYVDNPEYIRVITDANDRFLAGITPEGETKFAKGTLIDKEIADSTEIIEDELFLRAEVDADGKLLSGTKKDGSHYIRNVESETIPDEFEVFTDKENRLEVVTDVAGRIVSQRLPDGKLEEMVGVKTPKIELPSEGLSDLAAALKGIGAIKVMDWSDEALVQIPIPRTCAIINFHTAAQAETKTADIDTVMEFWDKDGNYFKKAILLNAQGSSSMGYVVKNQSIDINDGSEIKFGSWMPFDSFHLKKYFIDVFRGQCVVGYHLAEQIYQTRPYGERRAWDYINHTSSVSGGKGSFTKDFDTGALGHPDGFPVKVFFNGKNAGVYAFCIKKARGNYYCKKSKQDQILLDGVLGDSFFTANGNMAATGETGATLWNDFEIRNPKINKDINGNPYDGDAPTEPSNDFATCKANIARLTEAIPAVQAASSTEAKREKFEEYFNVPFVIDYDIIGNVLYHYDGYRKNWLWLTNDGEIWAPMVYDLDSIFGQHWNGASYVAESTTEILGTSDNLPTGLLKTIYQSEMRSRYAELRRGGVITVENIVGLLTDWIARIGYDNLKDDIENVVVSNYVEGGVTMPDKVPNTPSYRDGSLTYTTEPATGGWYNSTERVKNWLTARIAALDAYFNYNV